MQLLSNLDNAKILLSDKGVISVLTVDNTWRFCGQYRSRSDCTELAV